MRRFIHGVLAPNARPRPARVVRSKKKIVEDTLVDCLPKLRGISRPQICIIRRLGGLGDVMMTTPALKHVKRMLPKCHLVYATDLKYADGALGDILKYNPYIDELVDFRVCRGKQFDYSVDVTVTGLKKEIAGTIPPNRIDMFAERIGVDVSEDPLPVYIVSKEETAWAKGKLTSLDQPKGTQFIAIHARSNDARRTWPLANTKRLIELVSCTEGVYPILFDWAEDYSWKEKDAAVFIKLNIRMAMAIINECSCVVCPDSSILHLAGALNKKIVGIFGTTPPESRINHYPNATGLQAEGLGCGTPHGCWYRPSCLKSNSSNKLECFTRITPEMVLDTIKGKLLESNKTSIKKSANKKMVGNISPKNKKVILVKRRFGGFGDIVMSLSAIEALSKQYPEYEIHYALPEKFIPAAENCPFISKVLDYNSSVDKNIYRDGMIIDISNPCAFYESSRVRFKKKVEKSRVEVFAEAMGARKQLTDIKPRYYPTKTEIDWAKKFIGSKKTPIVGLILRTAEEYRNWPLKNFYVLAKKLQKEKFKVAIIDPTRDHDLDNVIDACGFPFRKSAAIVSQCDLIVTADTSHLHVAAALKVPVVALFGPIDPDARCKNYDNVTIITPELDCIPCWRTNTVPCRKTNLVAGYSHCMESIAVGKTYAAIEEMFECLRK